MPRAKIYGYISVLIALILGFAFFYYAFYCVFDLQLRDICCVSNYSYYAVAIPIGLVAMSVLVIGLWIGWTILTIKVAPPMPEIVERKDYAKPKALLLCLAALLLIVLFLYGVYLKSYWALALPAAAVTLVILGMLFWVGMAIITTRATLPEDKKK